MKLKRLRNAYNLGPIFHTRAWICRRNLNELADHFEEKAGVFLSDGAFFGWPTHFRFNFACPRSRMLEGLEKIRGAL